MTSPEALRLTAFIGDKRHTLVEVAAARLCRITTHTTGEPFYSRAKNNRFDAPVERGREPYGVHYCAPDLPTAFAESVLHDETHFDALRNRWVVSHSALLKQRWVVNLNRPAQPLLSLFPLCGELLTKLNIGNFISAGSDYNVSRTLSGVVHTREPRADGILYVSNRANQSLAVALFDRSGVGIQETAGRYLPLHLHPQFQATLGMYDVIATP